MKLTERVIQSLACPAGRRDMMVFDSKQSGLGVRVTASGGRTYLAQYTRNGVKRRIPLASCTAISLDQAREATRAIMGDVAKGLDPAVERKRAAAEAKRTEANDALTLDVLLEQWGALRLAHRRQSYALEAVRAIRRAFPKHLGLPAADLSRASVVAVLDDLARAGKIAMAARTAAYGRSCYHWAVKRGALDANPFTNMPLAPVAKRDRVLAEAELAAVWRAANGPGAFDRIVRMLILTGQRRGEVAGMAWSELDQDLSAWTIPAARAKNGVAHVVPLSPQAQALLKAAPKRTGERLVFPGMNGIFNGFGKAKAALDEECALPAWRLHDLRRTVATGLQKLGVRLEVTEAVLNHVSGSRAGIVGVYQRYDYADEKRAALAAWGRRVVDIVEGRDTSGAAAPVVPRPRPEREPRAGSYRAGART
ncbi:MAG TPA: integrase arm-type DNA-binding domain-containing protein [Roseiarcus sp.]|jgi:integrase